jgi:hypothetical protein
MAPGTSANTDLLHYYIQNELEVPLTGKSLYSELYYLKNFSPIPNSPFQGYSCLLTAMCSCDDEEALSKYMNLGACFHVLKPLDRRSFSILWHQACWPSISVYRWAASSPPHPHTHSARGRRRRWAQHTHTPHKQQLCCSENVAELNYFFHLLKNLIYTHTHT